MNWKNFCGIFNKKTEGLMLLGPSAVWRSTSRRSMTLRPHLTMGLPFRGLQNSMYLHNIDASYIDMIASICRKVK